MPRRRRRQGIKPKPDKVSKEDADKALAQEYADTPLEHQCDVCGGTEHDGEIILGRDFTLCGYCYITVPP